MKRAHTPVLAVVVSLGLMACGDGQTGTHIGNPTAGFALTVDSSDEAGPAGALTFRDDGNVLYTLTHARTYVRDVELYLPAGTACTDIAGALVGGTCEPDESGGFKVRLTGPFAVDLLSRSAVPSLAGVRIPALSYRRVDLRIDDGDPSDGVIEAGDELEDISLVARADFDYEDVPVELELALRFNETVRFEDAAGLPVSEADQLLAALDVAAWLQGLALGDCLDNGDLVVEDGRLRIDDNAGSGGCSDVEQVVRDNVEASGVLAVE